MESATGSRRKREKRQVVRVLAAMDILRRLADSPHLQFESRSSVEKSGRTRIYHTPDLRYAEQIIAAARSLELDVEATIDGRWSVENVRSSDGTIVFSEAEVKDVIAGSLPAVVLNEGKIVRPAPNGDGNVPEMNIIVNDLG